MIDRINIRDEQLVVRCDALTPAQRRALISIVNKYDDHRFDVDTSVLGQWVNNPSVENCIAYRGRIWWSLTSLESHLTNSGKIHYVNDAKLVTICDIAFNSGITDISDQHKVCMIDSYDEVTWFESFFDPIDTDYEIVASLPTVLQP